MRNRDFLGIAYKNPYAFRHYDISNCSLFVNGTQIPIGGLILYTGREKSTAMCYGTTVETSGVRHSNMCLQITHDMYIEGYFMLLFDLTHAPEGHTSQQ
jgi:hypothetical protein